MIQPISHLITICSCLTPPQQLILYIVGVRHHSSWTFACFYATVGTKINKEISANTINGGIFSIRFFSYRNVVRTAVLEAPSKPYDL